MQGLRAIEYHPNEDDIKGFEERAFYKPLHAFSSISPLTSF